MTAPTARGVRPRPTSASSDALPRLFRFAQLEFPGRIGLDDGRYLARDPDAADPEEPESVLVIKTEGAPPPPRRRRRRPKRTEPQAEMEPLPLSRITAVDAESLDDEGAGERWLEATAGDNDALDAFVAGAMGLLNRALRAAAVAAGDPYLRELTATRATRARIGFGTGEQVADGKFTAALDVDLTDHSRRGRVERIAPQERIAAILGYRATKDACELPLLRARTDLDAGDLREAALQLRVGLEALLVELRGALPDPGHEEDMAVLEERRGEAGAAANAALKGDLGAEHAQNVEDLLVFCERVLRRRRILRG